MKLLRLKLNVPFRSLPAGFEIHFLRENEQARCFDFQPYCFAGRNGSGKSNVLEALAAIFYHIECIYLDYRPDGFEFDAETNRFGFRAEKCTPDAFELEYLCANNGLQERTIQADGAAPSFAHIRIIKVKDHRPDFQWVNRGESADGAETEMTRREVKGLLPKYILGYSSGQNEILSLPFYKMRFIHYDEYRDHLTKEVPYSGRPEGRLIYLDEQFSQAILLCHSLFPCEAVREVFRDNIGLEGVQCFRLIIRRHHFVPVAPERLESMTPEEQGMPSKIRLELTRQLSGHLNERDELQLGVIDKLIRCSTAYYEDPHESGESSDLYLDYWINDATKQAFQFHFSAGMGRPKELEIAESALNLFQSLQALLTLNYYQVMDETKAIIYRAETFFSKDHAPLPSGHARIMRFQDLDIRKAGCREVLSIKALSDGEHQFLHTIGLCLLYRHESALFLLDEPETHLNPDWRASYISTLRAALEADAATKSVMREVLLTSHSPFVISDCQQENVLVFTKDENKSVTCERPDFQTFGASADFITMEIFDRPETIGDYANEKLKKMESKLGQSGQSPRELAREVDRAFGDSIEKTLSLSRILQGTKEN